jgi:hydroxymethylbilane synthase
MKINSITIGSRKSKLALWQSEYAKEKLQEIGIQNVETVLFTTQGDKNLSQCLTEIGGKGVFTQELECSLINGRIDIAVHSLKDLPVPLPEQFKILAVLEREDSRDVLISPKNYTLNTLPKSSIIGTSSLRRKAQLLAIRPDLRIVPIRGNVQTRIAKCKDNNFAGTILAYAGVKRMNMESYISEVLDPNIMMSAPGQGAIALEVTKAFKYSEFIEKVNHIKTYIETFAERYFLEALDGGCQTPIAANAVVTDSIIQLNGLIASVDGKYVVKVCKKGKAEDFKNIALAAAEEIKQKDCNNILASIAKDCSNEKR